MVYRDQDRYRILSRQGHELSDQFPELAFFEELVPGTVLDGELVVLEHGKPALSLVQARQQTQAAEKILALARTIPAVYVVFDQLFEDYQSLMDQPLARRRERLAATAAGVGQERFILSAGIVGSGKAFYEQVVCARLEGVMAKRLSGRYRPGRRSNSWLKIKWQVWSKLIVPDHSQTASAERRENSKQLSHRGWIFPPE
jgi:bifunctional non-homologous end joining protein LigD